MSAKKSQSGYRAGFVALVGEPNAGKSTLTNLLVGETVSIVTPKPQTTRTRVTGILSDADSQLVFVDSPGLIKSTSGLNTFLQDEARDVISSADVVIALLSADGSEGFAKELLTLLREEGKPFIAIVNKADLLKGTATPKFFKYLIEEKIPFFSVSALKRPKEARAEVIAAVRPLLPESVAPLYDDEIYTTQTLREMAGEAVREACFLNLKQEIPYGLAVRIREFKENSGPVVKIAAEIIVEKDNHKGIVIGAKGAMMKKIGTEARARIEAILGRQAYLELHVVVKPNWFKNKKLMEELGYVIKE
ncbi:MAG: GTPase Era [Bdellovibrionaceae bacterium]|nr:GTPase Era [Pseudobdellovibrionaceae bacterium]